MDEECLGEINRSGDSTQECLWNSLFGCLNFDGVTVLIGGCSLVGVVTFFHHHQGSSSLSMFKNWDASSREYVHRFSTVRLDVVGSCPIHHVAKSHSMGRDGFIKSRAIAVKLVTPTVLA